MGQQALGQNKKAETVSSTPQKESMVMNRMESGVNNSLTRNTQNASIYLPDTKSDAYKFANEFANSMFCPKAYQGKPSDVYLAMAYGAQIGLNPLLAVQNIAVVNGRPSVYGDALTAIVMGHPETQFYEDGYKSDGTAYCKITRKGRTVYREFSEAMARKAGLWGQGTWLKYPERMLMWRAKGWAIRDLYADVLMGMWSVEEARDMPNVLEDEIVNITPDITVKEKVKEQLKDQKQHKEHIVEQDIVEDQKPDNRELPQGNLFEQNAEE
ncbi:MAG: hypothetical protein AB7D24_11435 [Sphaerochaeta sp.]|uniref:hypothetical protein n=1 Tax=Sphaerochaeta sp. TaxID=1972642 RepID=UPI003D09B53A